MFKKSKTATIVYFYCFTRNCRTDNNIHNVNEWARKYAQCFYNGLLIIRGPPKREKLDIEYLLNQITRESKHGFRVSTQTLHLN